MADAEAALGRLEGIARFVPNPGLLVRPALVREAISSTRIEGTRASAAELYELDASEATPSPDLEEVVDAIRATEHAVARLESLPLSLRLVRETHAVLLAGARGRERRPGEFRTTQNWIGAPGSTIETATFVPPPPEAMRVALDDWERFVNARGMRMPVLAQCALMHYQLEAIHPFLDGNGRVGRVLIVVFLIDRGRLTRPVLSISPYLERRRDEYIARLQAVHELGEIDPWIQFFCRSVGEAATDGVGRARSLVELRERYRMLASGQRNAQALVDVLFEAPIATARLVEQRLAVTRPTALRLLARLADAGVLRERPPGPRSRRSWEANEILALIGAGD